MYLIVGLGNPGRRYAGTRHNAGSMVLDELFDRWRVSMQAGSGDFEYGRSERRDTSVVLLKPTTYMNESGRAVADAMALFACPPERVVVVYDDVMLPLGTLRIRARGSDGGHNGIASVILTLGTEEVPRVRLGVGLPPTETAEPGLSAYVLDRFEADELPTVNDMVKRGADAVESIVDEGIETAMNRFNRTITPP